VADKRRTLAELVPDPSELPDAYGDTVAATWSLSIALANQLAPAELAGPLLRIASLQDPVGIPLVLFTTDASINYLTGLLDRPVGAEDVSQALWVLHRLNLATVTTEQPHRGVQVHALVQRAVRDTFTGGDADTTAVREWGDLVWMAADALLALWPDIETDIDLTQALRTNAEILAGHGGHHLWRPDTHTLLFRVGISLGAAGLVRRAADYTDALHTAAITHRGPDDPETLAARGNVAHWRGEAGDVAGAAAAFEHILSDALRVLGPDHPQTLTTRNNLAAWRGHGGDVAGAVVAFEELLADRLRVLGPDHPETLIARNNLADWRGRGGDVAGAVVAFEEVLADRLRVLGPDHPDTLIARGNLANWRGRGGCCGCL
jgi:hypothetical protein